MRSQSILCFLHFAGLLAIGVCTGGCSSMTYVTFNGTGDSLSYVQFNEEIGREKLSVFSDSWNMQTSLDLRAAPDSCVWIDGETGKTMHAPFSEIKSAVVTDHMAGLWRGFLYGGLAGIGIGYVVLLSGDMRHEPLAVFVPASIGTIGATVGGFLGVLIGYNRVYLLRPYAGGATAVYLKDGSRIIGTIEEYIADKHIKMRTWDGTRSVIDHALIERIEPSMK